MLQIITGKFFQTEHVYVTAQQGILYANYEGFLPIKTRVGTLTPAASVRGVPAFVYSFDNRLEYDPVSQGVQLARVGTDEIISDFAVLVSFALRITCSPSQALVERLTQCAHPVRGDSRRPSAYVARVFDERLEQTPADEEMVASWVDAMLGLPRATYLRVIRAVRRYVTALHRVGDDLEVAYLLLVASLESLAQGFDDFQPVWERYSPKQRSRIDAALAEVEEPTAEQIRAALLAGEHQALGKRFVEFAVAHLKAPFFRDEARSLRNPLRRSDLASALTAAYGIRSGQVHTLAELPALLRLLPDADSMREGEEVLPTLGGLARLVHHVIRTFVDRQPHVEREEYNYRLELPGVISLPVAAQHWIFDAASYTVQSAPRYLTGFLEQLTQTLHDPEHPLTDLSAVLERIEGLVNGVAELQRLPMLALYQLYHWYTPFENHSPRHAGVIERHMMLFDRPSVEAAVVYVLQGEAMPWSPEETLSTYEAYLKKRYKSNRVNLGQTIETALLLETAEAFRASGNPERARAIISRALEEHPGEERLIDLEVQAQADDIPPIRWRDILLPSHPPVDDRAPPE